jgi:hypothetical protein
MKRALTGAERDQLETLRRDITAGRLTRSQVALKMRWRASANDWSQGVQELPANPTDALKNMFRVSLIQRIGEHRMRALDELVAELAVRHDIEDRFRLERAIDTAMLIYGHRRAMDGRDIERLAKDLSGVIEVLGRDENDLRLADMFLDRDHNLIEGGPWNAKEATDITMRILRLKDELVDLLDLLRRPRRREADLRLHATYSWLKRYWATLPGKKSAATFALDGSPKSEMLQFIRSVVGFINPSAVKKLGSASRSRL